MPLHPGPLLSLAAALVAFLPGGFCGSPSHSLCYFYWRLADPSQGPPQFFIRGYLDEQPIIRFDSLTRKREPQVSWMEEDDKEMFCVPEWVFRTDLEKLSKQDHHAGVLHNWQVVLGCELKEDGSKGGFLHYGYDGMDFISFDKETLSWVAAQSQAQKVKEKWEEDPEWSQGNKIFLEKTCIEWLKRYRSYEKKVLKSIQPPVGKVTRKVINETLEVLICQAFGFYPKGIWTTWMRDGQYEILHRNVAPNSDGTYYVRLSIEINPKERDHFQCQLEHEGLQKPLVLAWEEKTEWRIPMIIVIVLILGFKSLFLFYCWWRRMENVSQNVPTSDQGSLEKVPGPLVHDTEDEIQLQVILQPEIISEQGACCVRRPKKAPKVNMSTWSSRKQTRFRR